MATLELINITKKFRDVTAVDNVSLGVEDGEFVTLLGPSGCGKSTLLNMIAGLEDVTAGEIRISGKTVNQLGPFERDVAMVFQNYALYPHMTVEESIGFSIQLRKRPRSEIQAGVRRVAEMLELEKFLHRLPRELSGGQQQRVAIGRAVIREPSILPNLLPKPWPTTGPSSLIRASLKVCALNVCVVMTLHQGFKAFSLQTSGMA